MASASITMIDTHNPIPKESGSPVLGCLPQFSENPLLFMKNLAQQHKDVVEFHLPFIDIALISDADLAHKILVKEVKNFRKADREISIMGTVLGKGLVTNNDVQFHKTQRKLAQPGFHFRRIQAYAETMVEYTDHYIQSWANDEVRNISDDMFKLTMYIVSKTLFNVDMSELEQGADEIGDAMTVVQDVTNQRFNQIFQFPDWLPTPNNIRLKNARSVLHKAIKRMIDSRFQQSGNYEDTGDLMSMLLQARYEDGSKMDDTQIMDELITLFAAGHETTSNALTWTFYLLATHPEVQAKLQQELDQTITTKNPKFEQLDSLTYTEMVIKESMRIYPPVWTLSARQANEDIVVGDYFFPKDKTVFIAPYANHHNPRYFENPEQFDPERFSPENEKNIPRYAYIPFGAGPRVCIGNSFAMMEAKLILATIAKRYQIKLAKGQEINPLPQITLSNQGGMKVEISKR